MLQSGGRHRVIFSARDWAGSRQQRGGAQAATLSRARYDPVARWPSGAPGEVLGKANVAGEKSE